MNMLFAYIDPFTGSLILQVLAGGFMTLLLFFKRIKAFVLEFFGTKNEEESTDEVTDVHTISMSEKGREDRKVA